jgi:hypothetical protein
MIKGIGNFFYDKRNTFVWALAGTAGVYLVGKYAKYKIEELTKTAELEAVAQEKYVIKSIYPIVALRNDLSKTNKIRI